MEDNSQAQGTEETFLYDTVARAQQLCFMTIWDILEFTFILHCNKNESYPIFSQTRVVLTPKGLFLAYIILSLLSSLQKLPERLP